MPRLPSASGKKIIRTLVRLGFVVVRQKGSHVFLQKGKASTTVPLHDPVKKSTLKKILQQAGVSLDELLEEL